MLSLEELVQRVSAYRDGRIAFWDLENWFEDHSSAAYASSVLKPAWVALEGPFAQYRYDGIEEDELKDKLEEALAPFVTTSLRGL